MAYSSDPPTEDRPVKPRGILRGNGNRRGKQQEQQRWAGQGDEPRTCDDEAAADALDGPELGEVARHRWRRTRGRASARTRTRTRMDDPGRAAAGGGRRDSPRRRGDPIGDPLAWFVRETEARPPPRRGRGTSIARVGPTGLAQSVERPPGALNTCRWVVATRGPPINTCMYTSFL